MRHLWLKNELSAKVSFTHSSMYSSHMAAERGRQRIAERGDGPPRKRSRGDRGREGSGVERNHHDMTKDEIEAYEQQAADAREYAAKLEAELQRVYAAIFTLMDKNLIPSVRTGESKMPYYKMKGDDCRHFAESATRDAKSKAAEDASVEAPNVQITERVVEVPQVQYQEVVRHVTVPQVVTQKVVRQVPVSQVHVDVSMPLSFVQTVEQPYPVPQVMIQEVMVLMARPYSENLDGPNANLIMQAVENIVEVLQVQYTDKIVGVLVVAQRQVPTIQIVQKTVETPQGQFFDRVIDAIVVMQSHASQERIQERTVEETDVPVPLVMGKTIEVVKFIP